MKNRNLKSRDLWAFPLRGGGQGEQSRETCVSK